MKNPPAPTPAPVANAGGAASQFSFPPFPEWKGGISDQDPNTPAFLQAIQGNILQPHGRNYGRLLFFRFRDAEKKKEYRELLKEIVSAGWVTSAWTQRYVQSLIYKASVAAGSDRPVHPAAAELQAVAHRQLFASVMLTPQGLRFLELSGVQSLAKKGGESGEETPAKTELLNKSVPFNQQMNPLPYDVTMRDRIGAETGAKLVAGWSAPYTQEFHGMWVLASDDDTALQQDVDRLRQWADQRQVDVFAEERGARLRDEKDRTREPFGFVDGISMPAFFRNDRETKLSPWIDMDLSDVLVTPSMTSIPASEFLGGSYLALLKLEQDVKEFQENEARIAAQLTKELHVAPDTAARIAPALIMGRTREGDPLTKVWPDTANRVPEQEQNLFDFRSDPAKNTPPVEAVCPFHAHIRKVNPRVSSSSERPGTRREVVGTQVVRRSMVYGERDDLDRWQPGAAPPEWPAKPVGLLFMAYMTNTDTQFLRLHNEWTFDPAFPRVNEVPEVTGADALLYGRPADSPWKWRGVAMPPITPVVTRKGGAFFFVPSIAWLKAGGA